MLRGLILVAGCFVCISGGAKRAALKTGISKLGKKAMEKRAAKKEDHHEEAHGHFLIQSDHVGVSLIQSVREDHAVLFEEYKSEIVHTEEFCQSASLFTNTASVPLEYMTRVDAETRESFVNVRNYVQSLEFSTRKDDVRRSVDMREVWESSIVAELNKLVGVINHQVVQDGQNFESVEKIESKSSIETPHEHLSKKNKVFKKSSKEEKLEHIAEQDGGTEENSPQNWASQKSHYEETRKTLAEIAELIQSKLVESSVLFVDHVVKVVEGGDDYQLRWPSEFLQAKHENLPVEAAAALALLVADRTDMPMEKASEVAATLGDDSFVAAMAVPDGSDLVNAVREGRVSSEWLSGLSGSPSRILTELSNALIFLQVRRLGFIDARLSLMRLVEKVSEQMEGLTVSITATVVEISNKLKANEEMLVYTYRDASSFNGVTLDTSDSTDNFQTHLDALNLAYKSGDSLESMVPRISFIVNSARTLHSELISFVGAHSKMSASDKVEFEQVDKIASIQTHILHTFETVSEWLKNPAMPDIEQITADKLAEQEERARTTALCLLYGRIDGLEIHRIHENNSLEETLCGPSFEYGLAFSEKVGETYPQREESAEEDTHTENHQEKTE